MKLFIQLWASVLRIIALVALVAGVTGTSLSAISVMTATTAEAAVVRSISVRGNQRVDGDTVRSYVTVKPGKRFSSFDTDESLQSLFATGLFADVRITTRGNTLLVEVEENPVINVVLFEGNDKVNDQRLKATVQSESLGIFSQAKVDSDLERVREVVRRSGRASAAVNVRIDQLDNNRVNIIFQINEGGRTKITEINFVGNNAFGDSRLAEVISHNESNFLSWLKRDDIYDPDKLRSDEGRLRTFYFNRGYADFRVISAVGDFDSDSNSYAITITVDEGERYRFGAIDIDNALPSVDASLLQGELKIAPGDVYSARKVEKSLVAMTTAIARTGFAFAEVTPRGDRDFDNRTINITFFVDEGPRTYIERIDVRGNERSRDYVVRREFDISEGDAYNRVLVNQGKNRLEALGYFDSVRVSTRPGSAPDRIIIVVNVKDKATGEFSVGGGFSTTGGAVAEIALTEKNFLGRGQFLKISSGIGEESQKYSLSFTEPYFLGHRLAVGFDVSRETTDASNGVLYSSEITLGRLRASAPINDYLRASVNYTFKHEKISTSLPAASFSAATLDTVNRSPFTTSSLGYGLTFSTIDNLQKPREGIHATFSQDFAGAGGDAQYIRTTGRVSAYYLASEDADIVLFAGAGAGNIYQYGGGTLRVADHFFQGGETIRGFDSRGFGPRDSGTNEALGGTYYANATAEIQFPMLFLPRSFGLRAAVFAEAGTLFGSDFSGATVQDSSSIRASAGASIIWDSPFGPLRADFSHAFQKEAFDRTQLFRFGVSSKF